MSAVLSGGCECGAICFECAAEPIMAGHCYCRSCQKASGIGAAQLPRNARAVNTSPKEATHG